MCLLRTIEYSKFRDGRVCDDEIDIKEYRIWDADGYAHLCTGRRIVAFAAFVYLATRFNVHGSLSCTLPGIVTCSRRCRRVRYEEERNCLSSSLEMLRKTKKLPRMVQREQG